MRPVRCIAACSTFRRPCACGQNESITKRQICICRMHSILLFIHPRLFSGFTVCERTFLGKDLPGRMGIFFASSCSSMHRFVIRLKMRRWTSRATSLNGTMYSFEEPFLTEGSLCSAEATVRDVQLYMIIFA